jgi:NADH-quinone oxidoreductase subunit A
MFVNYTSIVSFLAFSTILSSIIFIASFSLALQNEDLEKVSAYECGFSPFEDSRDQFDVRFYLVAILFIIFDLEISFLFPWLVNLHIVSAFGYGCMMIFLLILTLGFYFEWKKGALEWN